MTTSGDERNHEHRRDKLDYILWNCIARIRICRIDKRYEMRRGQAGHCSCT
jgi:hypothetical protein